MEEEHKVFNNSLRLLAKSSVIVFIAILLSKLLSYSYRIIIARHMGPEMYGVFSLAFIIVGWIIAFSSLGLADGVLRYISLYRGEKQVEKIRYIFRKSIWISFALGLFFGVVLFLSAEFISINLFQSEELAIFLRCFSILIPVSLVLNIYLEAIRAYEKIGWYVFIYNVLQNAIKVIFLIVLILLALESEAIIFSYILGIISMLIVAYLICKYKLSEIFIKEKLNQNVKKEILKDLFSYSWPLLFFGIIANIFYNIDSFSVGYFKTVKEVGFYNAAVPIAILLRMAQELFAQLFFPMIIKEYAQKKFEVIKQLSQQIGKWIFIINLPVLILMVLFPGTIINILFGAEYLVAENALRFLAGGAFIYSLFMISNNLIIMMGKSKIILMDIIIACIVNLALNFILVPMPKIIFIENELGINGAAIATLLSLILLNLLFMIQARKYLRIIPLKRKIVRVFLVSLIPTALLLLMKSQIDVTNIINVGLLGVFFILSYFLLIFLSGCLDKNDMLIIKSIKKKILSGRK